MLPQKEFFQLQYFHFRKNFVGSILRVKFWDNQEHRSILYARRQSYSQFSLILPNTSPKPQNTELVSSLIIFFSVLSSPHDNSTYDILNPNHPLLRPQAERHTVRLSHLTFVRADGSTFTRALMYPS